MRKNVVFGTLVVAFLVATLALSAVTPSVNAQGGETPTPTPTASWTIEEAVALYSISGTYAVVECLYEGVVEPNCWKFAGSIQMVNPFTLWVDGYRKCAGEVRPSYAAMQRADRISIPPNFVTTQECFVEVLVARPLAPEQQSSLEERGESEVQWSVEEAVAFYQLEGPVVPLQRHGLQSWEVPFIEGQSWLVTNVCSNWVDGFRVNPGEVRPDFSNHPDGPRISIPPHSYQVAAEMATLRPCDEPQLFSVTPSGNGNVNLRSGPGESFDQVGTLVPGQIVSSDGYVLVDQEQWYRVSDSDGTRAWVTGWVVQVTPITTATTAAQPVPAAQSVQPAPADWSESTVRTLFALPVGVTLTQCAGETNCWVVASVPTSLTNSSGCWQDGYRAEAGEPRPGQEDPKVGIPPGFTGLVEAATLRPCS